MVYRIALNKSLVFNYLICWWFSRCKTCSEGSIKSLTVTVLCDLLPLFWFMVTSPLVHLQCLSHCWHWQLIIVNYATYIQWFRKEVCSAMVWRERETLTILLNHIQGVGVNVWTWTKVNLRGGGKERHCRFILLEEWKGLIDQSNSLYLVASQINFQFFPEVCPPPPYLSSLFWVEP